MSRGKWAMVIAALCLLVAVAAVAYAAGQAKVSAPEVIRAQRFEVVDTQGRVRAKLGVDPDGSPSLLLYDEKGTLHSGLDGDSLRLYDENGKGHSSLGGDSLVLFDENGKLRAMLSLLPDGGPSLSLFGGKDNFSNVILTLDSDGSGRLGVASAKETSSIVLAMQDNGSPMLSWLDKGRMSFWFGP